MTRFAPPHPFQVIEMRVWKDAHPEQARAVEVQDQTAKLQAIRRELLERRQSNERRRA